ncbi:hypothetical protein ABT095_07645 [Kitasatospora sp. NPDC002227]|uniref:hypothetical protein n=1 Tax=Kitasatospora sp. NPDC002227 TaxID=3154773 RepID=UPI003322FED8
MAVLVVLLVGISVIFSFTAFGGGNPFVGSVFALVAAAPVLCLVCLAATRGRRGGAPRGKGVTVALRLTALAMVGAVGYGGYWVVFEPKASDKALSRVSDLEDGCNGNMARKYFTQAAPHTGPGPHPVAMFTVTESGSPQAAYPPADAPDYWSGAKLDPHRVQLIACLGSPDEGRFLADCKFTADSIKLYQGEYEVTVYEARTGQKLGAEHLSGSAKPACPGLVYLKQGAGQLHTSPEFADYQAVLRHYVEG